MESNQLSSRVVSHRDRESILKRSNGGSGHYEETVSLNKTISPFKSFSLRRPKPPVEKLEDVNITHKSSCSQPPSGIGSQRLTLSSIHTKVLPTANSDIVASDKIKTAKRIKSATRSPTVEVTTLDILPSPGTPRGKADGSSSNVKPSVGNGVAGGGGACNESKTVGSGKDSKPGSKSSTSIAHNKSVTKDQELKTTPTARSSAGTGVSGKDVKLGKVAAASTVSSAKGMKVSPIGGTKETKVSAICTAKGAKVDKVNKTSSVTDSTRKDIKGNKQVSAVPSSSTASPLKSDRSQEVVKRSANSPSEPVISSVSMDPATNITHNCQTTALETSTPPGVNEANSPEGDLKLSTTGSVKTSTVMNNGSGPTGKPSSQGIQDSVDSQKEVDLCSVTSV